MVVLRGYWGRLPPATPSLLLLPPRLILTPSRPFRSLPSFSLLSLSLSSSLSHSFACTRLSLSLSRALAHSSFLLLFRTRARTPRSSSFHRRILSLSLSFPFMFHSFVLVHPPFYTPRTPFVTNRATLHERQKGPSSRETFAHVFLYWLTIDHEPDISTRKLCLYVYRLKIIFLIQRCLLYFFNF